MKNTYNLFLALFVILLVSCEDPDRGPVFYYGDLEAGTYIRLVENSGSFLVDQNDFDNYEYTYTVEFVDAIKGSSVESYTVDLTYLVSGAATSTIKTIEDFVSLESSDFTTNDNGFAEATVTFTSSDLLTAMDLTEEDLSVEDRFGFIGEIVTPSNTYNSGNSSATVEGSFFQGYFNFSLFVGCASELEGEYDVITTEINCSTGNPGAKSLKHKLEIIDTRAIAIGHYEFKDASFGVLEDCFEGEGLLSGFQFKEICGVVTFSAVTDAYGLVWDYSSEIVGNDWIITWSNPETGFGGVTAINFKEGVPFTIPAE